MLFKLPFQGAGGGFARIYPGRCHWAELICPFRAPRCQRSIIILLCVKKLAHGLVFKLPFQGAGGGVAHIYPGRCHWAELNCPFQGAPLPVINNHSPVCQKSLAWVFRVMIFQVSIKIFKAFGMKALSVLKNIQI